MSFVFRLICEVVNITVSVQPHHVSPCASNLSGSESGLDRRQIVQARESNHQL